MFEKIYIVQRRKLTIREVFVANSTVVFVKDIGTYVFFDKESANKKLEELILERGAK